ncbi:HAD family hydrolase [Lapidilactobacillus bayanensis]|uniref:HAD family hydrolase n=1 Tax=Lapidilactobacillus bayanensis TaxID=2485998 RepID=UPI000F77C48E|nr:HAD family hydrolase [Lapidilactobacillus bayanensis]
MTIRQIFSDMDGTLLNSAGDVSPENARIIREAGIPFTLVSARSPMEMSAAIDQLQLTGPQIGYNGGLIFQKGANDWQVIEKNLLAFKTAKTLVTHLKAEFPDLSISIYDLNRWYTDRIDAAIKFEAKITKISPDLVNFTDYLAESREIFKIMLVTFSEARMKDLLMFLNDLALPGIAFAQSGTTYLEVTNAAAVKSKGIDYIIAREQLTIAETAAFGDGHNDLPMLQMVGHALVMANALPEIKAVADTIVPSNNENGVGYGIENYLLAKSAAL